MTIENVAITTALPDFKVVGHISLNEAVECVLRAGGEFRLSGTTITTQSGLEVVRIDLTAIPAERG